MDLNRESEAASTKNPTLVERKSEREVVVTRTVNAPVRLCASSSKPEPGRNSSGSGGCRSRTD